ncbi:MAG: hypothetical protein ACXVJ7_01830 [Acidimicrobiia bacterium]
MGRQARRVGVGLVVGVIVLGAAACSSDGSTAKPHRTTTTSTTPNGVPSGTAGTTPPPVVEGRTGWVDVTAHWKQLAPKPFDESPQRVADDLAALRRGEDTSEVGQVAVVAVQSGEPLVVVLRETGVPDIAVVETDTEITLEGGDEGWAVSKARRQSACRKAPVPAAPNRCPS